MSVLIQCDGLFNIANKLATITTTKKKQFVRAFKRPQIMRALRKIKWIFVHKKHALILSEWALLNVTSSGDSTSTSHQTIFIRVLKRSAFVLMLNSLVAQGERSQVFCACTTSCVAVETNIWDKQFPNTQSSVCVCVLGAQIYGQPFLACYRVFGGSTEIVHISYTQRLVMVCEPNGDWFERRQESLWCARN